MYIARLLIIFTFAICTTAIAGDDSSGPIKYELDLGTPFTTYQLTNSDRAWGEKLAGKFKYKGKIAYFVRTSLPLTVDGKNVAGGVYQRLDEPRCFYVVPGDYVLKIGTEWPASPGVGGFTLNAPKSKNFLTCMNCHCGGVPALSSTPIVKGPVSWKGHAYNRL